MRVMVTTNGELAEVLNQSFGLSGPQRVTVNVIREWVGWDVLARASVIGRSSGGGPIWTRSSSEMRRARRLAELRKLGVRRKSAVIVQAFIEWGHRDFELVRSALLHELEKGRALLARRRTTYMANADYGELSAVKQRAIRTQLGPLDNRFVDTQFQQSNEFYATIAQLAETGGGNALRQQELLLGAFRRMVPEFGQLLSDAQISSFRQSISGFIGSPDEIANSAIEEIKDISERELRIARVLTQRIWRMPRQIRAMGEIFKLPPALSELLEIQNSIFPQITVGQWAVIQLAQCALLTRRAR